MPESRSSASGSLPFELPAGVLVDTEIKGLVSQGQLIARNTFSEACLEASSYDIRVGQKGIIGGEGKEINLANDPLELSPGAYCGVVSLEKLVLPQQIIARIGSKRALSYDGVILLTGSLVDPGYEGHLLFGLYNASQRRVVLRQGKKICNIVFERLASPSSKDAPSDVNLKFGNLPDAFVDRMANMDVLPWMQISERVKQVEQLTKDILDLKARYEDVLKPIRDLTENVNNLTHDVSALAEQSKGLNKDLGNVNQLVAENGRQINQLTNHLATVVAQFDSVKDRTKSVEEGSKKQSDKLEGLSTKFARFSIAVYVFWGLVILVMGAFLREIGSKLFAP
jgi:dCTP deaminase